MYVLYLKYKVFKNMGQALKGGTAHTTNNFCIGNQNPSNSAKSTVCLISTRSCTAVHNINSEEDNEIFKRYHMLCNKNYASEQLLNECHCF